MRRPLLAPIPILVLVAAPVAAADTLPLARGAYVEQGNSCRDPANAALRNFDGQGIGSRNAGQCHGRVVARIGARYTLSQSCVQYGVAAGQSPSRATQRLKIRVDGPAAFTDIITRQHYRLCPNVRL